MFISITSVCFFSKVAYKKDNSFKKEKNVVTLFFKNLFYT